MRNDTAAPHRPYRDRPTGELQFIRFAYEKIGEPMPVDLAMELNERREDPFG